MMVHYTYNINKCLVLKVRKGGEKQKGKEERKIRKQAASNLYMSKTKEGKLGFQEVEVVIEAIGSSLLRFSPQIWTSISCFRNF